jgi:hypothetical protein
MLEEMDALKQHWHDLYPLFPEIRDEMRSRVVRWEWANGAHFATLHYYLQQARQQKQLLGLPSSNARNDSGDYRYGYDAEGRIVMSHLAGEAWERLYDFGEKLIETTNYHSSYPFLRGISRVYHENNRPTHTIGFFLQGHHSEFGGTPEETWNSALQRDLNLVVDREDYTYEGEALVHIHTKHWEHGWHHLEPDRLVEGEYLFYYSPNGNLDRITWGLLKAGRTYIVYRRLQLGESLQSLTEDVKSKLIQAIPKMIQQAGFTEPLYCIQLQYLDGRFFPPRIIPGLESHRQQYLAIYGNERSWMVWVTVKEYEADVDPALPIKDSAILEACEKLQLEAGYRHGTKTLYRIACSLNQLNWSNYAPVTPDFIVFAYDEEFPEKALRLSGATPNQMTEWRKQGIL